MSVFKSKFIFQVKLAFSHVYTILLHYLYKDMAGIDHFKSIDK